MPAERPEMVENVQTQVDEDNCRRGLVVTRGPAWEWGEQDGGPGGVGVILRQFYVDNPYKHTDKFLADDGEDASALGLEAPDKLCLVQVRWASSCVQTYRIGTYGKLTMTVSDLCIAPDQHHPAALPLKKLYEFRARADKDLEDLASVHLGNEIPGPWDLESMLLRFFRPKPNAIATMREVGDFLRDELIPEEEHGSSVCDFCDTLLCHTDEVCKPVPVRSENGIIPVQAQVWATRLPCGHFFHRDCIRLCLMDHNACPCRDCNQTFQSYCGGDMDEDWGDDGDAEFVSGETLTFISENRSVWIRMASVIQHFETVDNMSITTRLLSPGDISCIGEAEPHTALSVPLANGASSSCRLERPGSFGEGRSSLGSLGELRHSWGSSGRDPVPTPYGSPPLSVVEGKGRQRHAYVRKMRDVLTCVDLPQLQEAGWRIWDAFDMLVMGVRDRNQLVSHDMDAQSAALVDHLLDLVTQPQDEIERELKYGRRTSPGSSPAWGGSKQGAAWQAPAVTEQMQQVFELLGFLASTTSADPDAQHSDEPLLDVAQMRIYVVPLLEYLLAVDPLGAAFDLLLAGERDEAEILAKSGHPASADKDSAALVTKLVQAVVAADDLGQGGRTARRADLEGKTSEGRRLLGQLRLSIFQLALQSYERSSASVRGRRISASRLKSGLRWLSNVAVGLRCVWACVYVCGRGGIRLCATLVRAFLFEQTL